MLFGQHFDGEPPRNLNHVFLRQFENGFNKKIGMFMFKNQNDGATLRPAGGVKHSDSDLVETRMLSAKKALRWIEGSILSNSRKF